MLDLQTGMVTPGSQPLHHSSAAEEKLPPRGRSTIIGLFGAPCLGDPPTLQPPTRDCWGLFGYWGVLRSLANIGVLRGPVKGAPIHPMT